MTEALPWTGWRKNKSAASPPPDDYCSGAALSAPTYCGTTWHSWATALIKFLDTKSGQFDETLSDEVRDLVTVLRHSIELIDKVAITDQVHNRNVLNLLRTKKKHQSESQQHKTESFIHLL